MRVRRFVTDLLLPPRCPLCDRVVGFAPACPVCGDKLPALRRADPAVPRPGRSFAFLDGAWAPFWYEEPVQGAVVRMKGEARRDVALLFAGEMLAVLPTTGAPPFGCVVPVPPGKAEARRRGRFDGPLTMAEALAAGLGAPLRADVLYKAFDTPPQHTLSGARRRDNLVGAFAVRPGTAGLAAGQCVLLVDDVFTTGATLNECAKMLKAAGAARCLAVCIALARTPEEKRRQAETGGQKNRPEG